MEIDWETIGQDRFDRIVEAILNRLYDGVDEFRVYDGRGGDGGKDVYIRQGKRTRIFQLKYFPEGFSSINVRRRSQIKRSFDAAMEHDPDFWTLIVPCRLTDTEQQYVEGLRGDHRTKVDHLGRPWLDDRMATFPDLAAYFSRDDSMEKAKIYNREIDVLTGGMNDVASRVRALGRVIDDAEPDWALDFSRRNDDVVQVLRAKHARASEVSPIGLEFEFSFDEGYEDLQAAVQRVTDYGTSEDITLPPEVVKHFEVTGPALVAQEGDSAEVRIIGQLHNVDLPVDLIFEDEFGKVLASHSGVARHAGQAQRGRSLLLNFYGPLNLTFLIPHADRQGQIQLNLNFKAPNPDDALRVLSLVDALVVNKRVRLRFAEGDLMSIDLPGDGGSPLGGTWAEFEQFRLLAEDLSIVQRHCDVYFPIPDSVSAEDRVFLRCARLLIDGKCVVVPRMGQLNARLNGNDGPQIRAVLSGMPGALMAEYEQFGFELFGRSLTLGFARVYSPKVVIRNASEALAALDAGTAKDFKIEAIPDGYKSFWTFMPGQQVGDPDEPLVPVGWGLEGFNDPPDATADVSKRP